MAACRRGHECGSAFGLRRQTLEWDATYLRATSQEACGSQRKVSLRSKPIN